MRVRDSLHCLFPHVIGREVTQVVLVFFFAVDSFAPGLDPFSVVYCFPVLMFALVRSSRCP